MAPARRTRGGLPWRRGRSKWVTPAPPALARRPASGVAWRQRASQCGSHAHQRAKAHSASSVTSSAPMTMRARRAPLCEAVDCVAGAGAGVPAGAGAGAGAGVAAVVVALGATVVVAGGCVAAPVPVVPGAVVPVPVVPVVAPAAAVVVFAAFSSALVQPFARLAAATAS